MPLSVVGTLAEHRRVDGVPFRNLDRHLLALNRNSDELFSGTDDVKQGPVPLSPERCGNCFGSQISGVGRPHHHRRVDAVEGGVGDALVAVDEREAHAVSRTGEPVAVLLLSAVPTLVAWWTLAPAKNGYSFSSCRSQSNLLVYYTRSLGLL